MLGPSLTVYNATDGDNVKVVPQRTRIIESHYQIIWISGMTSIFFLAICSLYLCIFTSKRTREIGQMKWKDFMKCSSLLMKIAMVLEIVDIITDYMYSTALIRQSMTNYDAYSTKQDADSEKYSSITRIAWISLVYGVLDHYYLFVN